MDHNISHIRKYHELDLLFFLIKFNAPIHYEDLLLKVNDAIPTINQQQIEVLLQKLVDDQHVIKSDEELLFLNILSKDFLGYSHDLMLDESKTKSKTRSEKIYKLLPLVPAVIFGLTTIFFSYSAYNINKEKQKIDKVNFEKDKIIDQLSNELKKNKSPQPELLKSDSIQQ